MIWSKSRIYDFEIEKQRKVIWVWYNRLLVLPGIGFIRVTRIVQMELNYESVSTIYEILRSPHLNSNVIIAHAIYNKVF